MDSEIGRIYERLYLRFGPQKWWPATSSFEVIIGAILTQNTSWSNVTKAISNLKKEKALNAGKLYRMKTKNLALLIRPAGYFNIKAKRIKSFLQFFFKEYNGSINKMFKSRTNLREELLSVSGIGNETADSILLYAGNLAYFVVDAYTRRVLLRHKIIKDNASYEDIQKIFTKGLPLNYKLFNEYHALLVRLAKEVCLKNAPLCKICPLNNN